ncbi:hypothetical protein AAC387_Pa02g4750 [Persea americana]
MPGLVKTPPNATPIRILVPTGSNTHLIQTNEEESSSRNPNPRSPPILPKNPLAILRHPLQTLSQQEEKPARKP